MIITNPLIKIKQIFFLFSLFYFFNKIYMYAIYMTNTNIFFVINILPIILSSISVILIIRELNYYRAVMVRSHIKEVLLFTIDVLNNNNIKYWLDFGTLLGYYRDKSIILYDPDADITIDIEHRDIAFKILKEACHKETNFVFEERKNKKGVKWFRIYNLKDNFFSRKRHIDCYSVYKIKNGILYLSSNNNGDNIPASLVYPLKTIYSNNFYKKKINITNNVRATLRYRYGGDFMKPIHMYKGRANGKYKYFIRIILKFLTWFLIY